jgi:hypothetical protein
MATPVERTVRSLEILLGLSFVLAAALKALDLEVFAVQISYYGVVRTPSLVRFAAYATTILETGLGVALLVGIRLRCWTYAVTTGLLIGFTGLIGYAWAFHGLSDCGCFGAFVKMTPGVSILKNVIMVAMVCMAWFLHQRHGIQYAEREPARGLAYAKPATAVLSVGLVIIAGIYGSGGASKRGPGGDSAGAGTAGPDKERPFAQFRFEWKGEQWDLGQGRYLVTMLSGSCEHCMAAVEPLNDFALIPEFPPVVGLMLGDEGTVLEFRELTDPQFPTVLIDTLVFFQFIDVEPPRFYDVQDGKSLRFWDGEPPHVDAFLGENGKA